MKQIHSLAVFCGSKSGNNPLFESDAAALGDILAKKNVTLIYGGGNKGIMGAVANAVLNAHGKVFGVMPVLLKEFEQHHEGITELVIVEDMHIRKKILYEKADAAIILPGGFGTLDELFEMLTWNQLNIHNKKIFILNTAGFYDHLLAHTRMMALEGFLYGDIDSRITVIAQPSDIDAFL